MEKIKLYTIRLTLLLLLSCGNYYNSSLESLSTAFSDWYLIQNPEFENSLEPYNYYVKNNNMNSNYLNEYILDLKRFRLELMQINKYKLNRKNMYIHNSIEDKIELLIFNHENFRYYQYNPSYYFEIINNHLLDLLINDTITNNHKNNFIIKTLDLIPGFVSKVSKNIIISNELFIEKSNLELQKTIELIDNIPLYIELNDSLLKIIENKIDKNKKYLKRCTDWMNNDLSSDFKFDNDKTSQIHNNHILSLQKKYSHENLLHSLDLTIKNLQNNIFDLSLPIYLENNDEPIWLDREDTLNVINYVIKNKFNNKNIELDNVSKIIDFNKNYESLLDFVNTQGIVRTNEFNDINFPDYDIFFEQDKAVFLSNISYDIKNIQVLFNNSYKHIDDNEIYSFIINNILVKHIFNLYSIDNTSIIYNDINHYAWGNLLSKIIIQHKPQFLDSNFEIYHNIQLLRDFTKLSVRHKYFYENMNKTEALSIIAKETFINDSDITDDIWIDMLYNNDFNLEHYAAYIYISNLYDTHCIINNSISTKKIIKKIFQYGFIPVHNYKSILN